MHMLAKKNHTTSLNRFKAFFGGIHNPLIMKNEFTKLADSPPISIQKDMNLLWLDNILKKLKKLINNMYHCFFIKII